MKNSDTITMGRINADILSILEITKFIGWDKVSKLSIYRILYLSSVLYSFMYEDKSNPFLKDYNFIIKLRGPYYHLISNSINYLLINGYIEAQEKDFYILLNDTSNIELTKISNYNLKKEWLKIIIYILGIYGENNIYDFVFRDPEYQNSIKKNNLKGINLEKDNKTIEVLNEFKILFEESLKEEKIILDDKRYLELYFEYIISKILKGEGNHV